MKKISLSVSIVYFIGVIILLSMLGVLFYPEVFVVVCIIFPTVYVMKKDMGAMSFSIYTSATALLVRLLIPYIMRASGVVLSGDNYTAFMRPYAGLLMVTVLILYAAITTVCVVIRMGKVATAKEENGEDGTLCLFKYNVVVKCNLISIAVASILCIPVYGMTSMLMSIAMSLFIYVVCAIAFSHSRLDVHKQVLEIRKKKLESA